MLVVVGVDVVASVLMCERQKNVPSRRIRVASDGRGLLRDLQKHGSMNVTVRLLMMHVCSAFACIDRTLESLDCTCLFVIHRQRVLRAHGEWSEVGGPGPSPVCGRGDGESQGGVCEGTHLYHRSPVCLKEKYVLALVTLLVRYVVCWLC